MPADAGQDQRTDQGRREEDDLQTKYLLALAEVENTKKRLQRRADDAARALKKRLLLKFLPVFDNLERAVGHGDSEDLRAGLDATLRGFESALQSEGVTPISSTAGTRFDPNVAEAIGTQRDESVDDETVLAETQRGYRVDDDLLRPAYVVVAKNA
jgi:molecular chaperone GrpE